MLTLQGMTTSSRAKTFRLKICKYGTPDNVKTFLILFNPPPGTQVRVKELEKKAVEQQLEILEQQESLAAGEREVQRLLADVSELKVSAGV